ncbi:hypothetical protein HDIA_0708 [Hartmannibacter diazotrophicus]|uniref:DUF2800 domain-containing protein n=1 Tax=Hartmannibacter diazotrophicus TaxID=1482074 RepID=A0A2C9D261_9HYPH|nr:DUF2800 domain-containing protein [Hartmannibacter diazotrophicus]SON54249.1 hypothetical protein HDIA_0708 [Hartmannibacter diazotrophicus]
MRVLREISSVSQGTETISRQTTQTVGLTMAHARNAPSDAKRWMGCAGAINRCKKLGLNSDQSSFAAAEGTIAHRVANDYCFNLGFEPYDLLGRRMSADGYHFVVDEAMCDAIQPGLDRLAEFEGQRFSEYRVNITPWVGKDEDGNDQLGTLDRGIVGRKEIVIGDLKYGAGIAVPCVGNPQVPIYGLGFWNDVARHISDAKVFRFIIDQPRNGRGGGEWILTLDELLAFGEEVKARAALTFDEDAPCTPSDEACLWCPAAKVDGACPEYEAWNLSSFDIDFDDLDALEDGDEIELPEVEGLNVKRKAAIYMRLTALRGFLSRIEQTVSADVKLGDGAKYGLKLVAGKRSKRVHVDEGLSERYLVRKGVPRSKLINEKLISVAQLDKVYGKGKFPSFLFTGGIQQPVIVPLEDARPALLTDSVFEDYGEEGVDD